MYVALRDSYVAYVIFSGVTEKYPSWFEEEIYHDNVIMDEDRYSFYVYSDERNMGYYEKQLIEDYSVFLRKPDGEVHVTDWDTFSELYRVFRFDEFTHSGLAALHGDCIEYVECQGGTLPKGYPIWFYDYFTEALNYPQDGETFFFYDSNRHTLKASRDSIEVTAGGDVTVTEHCVFLLNKHGEIRGMRYDEFLKYYDPNPTLGIDF